MRDPGPEEHREGRGLLRRLGVSEEVLDDAEVTNPGINWIRLIWALDNIFLGYGGMLAQASFLRDPQPHLDGATPVDVLAQAGGFDRVCEAARAFGRSGPLSAS